MRLTEILKRECVKIPLQATDKQGAVNELVDLLCEQMGIANREPLRQAVWERELIRTTGIGRGVAIPHGKCEGPDRLIMAVGRPAQAIDFNAIDKRPVDLIFLLASPHDQTGPHIQALATISRMLTNSQFRVAVQMARTAAELYGVIQEHESKLAM